MWENEDKTWPKPPQPIPDKRFKVGEVVQCTSPLFPLVLGQLYTITEINSWGVHVSTVPGTAFVESRFSKVDLRPDTEEPRLRSFSTGATRNLDNNKLDHEGFLSPSALLAFGQYMHSHRTQADGTVRDSDNWQKGIPDDVYVKSMFRHFFDVWSLHRGLSPLSPEDNHPITMSEALCALLFNVQGLLHETLKKESSCPTASL